MASELVDAPRAPSPKSSGEQFVSDALIRMVIRFRGGLQLADLKAQLIVSRLSGLGDIKSTRPEMDELADVDPLDEFEVLLHVVDEVDAEIQMPVGHV